MQPLKKEFLKKYGKLRYHGYGFVINAVLTAFDSLDEQGKIKLCERLGIDYDNYRYWVLV